MIGSSVPIATDIVLVGGGHSHVEVLRRFAMQPQPGVRLTMIARDVDTPYSGMVPGYFAGHYAREDCHIDLRPLCIAAGARLFHASASGIDPGAQTVEVEGCPPVPYDFLSIDIGSVPDSSILPGASACTIPVKPIDRLLASVAGIEAVFERSRDAMRIAVIGAGAGGIELTLALHHRLTVGGVAPEFIVLDAAPAILPTHASGARRAIGRTLKARGIEVRLNAPVASVEAGRLVLTSGEEVAFDHAILVSGASAAPWLAASGLSLDARGFVRVDGTLRSVSHPAIFAAGDIVSFDQRPLAKSGVYAVRQGPVLAQNLRRAALEQALVRFHPQRHALALIATGPKHAVASRGPFALSGGYLWNLKDRIDRRFMEKYADLPPMRPQQSATDENPFAEMRCGGCGAKIGRDVLSRVLSRMFEISGAGFALDPDMADDAAIVAPPGAGEVAVQTVDQFRAFVDDPYLFGRITANHCLGDLHAMGARPKTALAMVMLPEAPAGRQENDLVALLAGACEVLGKAGAVLAGGHTGEGAELQFGLALTGHGREDRLLRRSGLAAGDALILTKPLGTGVLFNADMQGRAAGSDISAALHEMQASSAKAASVLIEHGARAACDVTGFGLAGHLIEMLAASNADATLELAAVPALDGALDLIEAGFESTLAPTNRAAALGVMAPSNDPRSGLLFDPQTAGGLLAGMPHEGAGACVEALRDAGYSQAVTIGEITARAGTAPWITFAGHPARQA